MTAKTKKILTILLVTLGITAFVITPLAWFANYWAQHSAGFNPGANPATPSSIEMWTFNTDEDVDADSTLTPGWAKVDYNKNPDGTGYIVMGPKTDGKVGDDGKEEDAFMLTLNKMQFGVVDNLGSLKEDNIIYLKLAIPAANIEQKSFSVNLDYIYSGTAPTAAELYKSITLFGTTNATTGTTKQITFLEDETKRVTGETYLNDLIDIPVKDGFADISNEKCHFMQIACAISIYDMEPGTDAFEVLKFTNFDPVGGEKITFSGDSFDNHVASHTTATTAAPAGGDDSVGPASDDENTTGESTSPAYYYIYLKIAPRLEFFVVQDKLLDAFVPSYIFFDTKLEIEFY